MSDNPNQQDSLPLDEVNIQPLSDYLEDELGEGRIAQDDDLEGELGEGEGGEVKDQGTDFAASEIREVPSFERLKQRAEEAFRQERNQKVIELREEGGRDLLRIEDPHIEQARMLCVPPSDYETLAKQFSESGDDRAFVIVGKERTGKRTLALRFSSEYLSPKFTQNGIYEYRPAVRKRSLIDIALDENVKQQTTIIVYLDRCLGDSAADLDHYFLFKQYLKDKDTCLILLDTQGLPEARSLPHCSTDTLSFEAIYKHYIEYYFDPSFEANQSKRKLFNRVEFQEMVLATVTHAIDIRVIFDEWSKVPTDEIERILAGLEGADQGDAQPQVRADAMELIKVHLEKMVQAITRLSPGEWFQSLTLNEKLYAMIVVLCQGAEVFHVEEIYEKSVLTLRRDGINALVDPRRLNLSHLRQRTGVQMTGNRLSFDNPDFEEITRSQIENYHRLLWSLSEWFANHIRESQREEQLLRQIIANVLARIGIYHKPKLALLLNDLAYRPQAYVVDATAYILRAMADDPQQHDFIVGASDIQESSKPSKDGVSDDAEMLSPLESGMLVYWANSGNSDLFWAAAAGIRKVYASFARQDAAQILDKLDSLLTTLCKQYNHFSQEIEQKQEELFRSAALDVVNRELQEESEENRSAFLQMYVNHEMTLWRCSIEAQNRAAILLALEEIAQENTERVVRLIQTWLTNRDVESHQWQMGRMAINHLFTVARNLTDVQLPRRGFPLLKLVPEVLDSSRLTQAAFDEYVKLVLFDQEMAERGSIHQRLIAQRASSRPISVMMEVLLTWYETASGKRKHELQQEESDGNNFIDEDIDEDEEADTGTRPDEASDVPPPISGYDGSDTWKREVYGALLKAVNSGTQDTRRLLRDALVEHWINSEFVFIRHAAHGLIARSHVMDGVVMDLPVHHRYGVVLIETGRRAKSEYLRHVTELVQRLSALAPIRVYRLGRSSDPFYLGQVDMLDEPVISESPQLEESGLPLVMPILDSLDDSRIAPEACHFVLILNLRPVRDLRDLFPTVPAQPGPLNPPNSTWVWKDKIFVIPHPDPVKEGGRSNEDGKNIPDFARQMVNAVIITGYLNQATYQAVLNKPFRDRVIVDRIDETAVHWLETRLREQISATLHNLSFEQWQEDLKPYLQDIDQDSEVINRLNEWVPTIDLAMIQARGDEHPKDVTLTISWAILAISRRSSTHLEQAVETVIKWLESHEMPTQEGESPDTRTERDALTSQIGSACARMLFNFYGTEGFLGTPDDLAVLLRLLSPLLRLQRGYSEIVPILETLLRWAKDDAWSQRLLEETETADVQEGGELFHALGFLTKREDLQALLNTIERYENLNRASALLVRSKLRLHEFISLTNTVAKAEASRARSGNSRMKLPHLPEGIGTDELLLLPRLPQVEINWILEQLTHDQRQLTATTPHELETKLRALNNQQLVLDSLRLAAQSKLKGELPKLNPGNVYGVILVDLTPKSSTIKTAIDVANTILKKRKDGKGEHIILTVHPLGQEQIAFSSGRKRGNKLRRDHLRPQSTRRSVGLIGPALERYPENQVGYVLIIGATEIHDLADFARNEAWRSKMRIDSAYTWPVEDGIAKERMSENLDAFVDKLIEQTTKGLGEA